MKSKEPRKKHSAAKKYINKWLALLTGAITIGGIFAYGLTAYLADLLGEKSRDAYSPVWMAIPAMIVISVPITLYIKYDLQTFQCFDRSDEQCCRW